MSNTIETVALTASKLADLRARKALRDDTRKAEAERLEAEALELEEKYEDSGKRCGIDFAVVTTAVGNFVVRKPDFIVAKKFSDAKEKGVEEIIQFVSPCMLFPDTLAARAVFQEHGGIAWKLALALLKMYEADASDRMGK